MRTVQIPPGSVGPLRQLIADAKEKAAAAAEAELRVGLFVEGLCHGLGEPFPPQSIDDETGELTYETNAGEPPEDPAPPE